MTLSTSLRVNLMTFGGGNDGHAGLDDAEILKHLDLRPRPVNRIGNAKKNVELVKHMLQQAAADVIRPVTRLEQGKSKRAD